MKIIFIGIYCMTVVHTFAQSDYSKFIECKKITWAADVSDTVRFSSLNLSLLFRQALIDGKIKASFAEDNFQLQKRKTVGIDEVRHRIAPNSKIGTVDDQGNITATIIETSDPLVAETYFDSAIANLLEAHEIMYIKDGKPLSYTPWLSPKYNVFTSWGEKLGIANAFSTAFNSSQKLRKSLSKKAIFIGQTQRRLRLQAPGIKMLKQLYEQNFIEALWPYLAGKGYHFFDVAKSVSMEWKEINNRLVDNREITVPVYDSLGNPGVKKIPYPPLSLPDIQEVSITESWYYNKKKQIAYSKIKIITMYAKVWHNGIQQQEASPILNIAVD